MPHDDDGPVILPIGLDPGPGLPDTRIRDIFVIDGVPHGLTVCIWGDDSCTIELVNLASGASCPVCEGPSRDGRLSGQASPSSRR